MIESEEIAALKKYVNFIPVCPEIELGLGVPREPLTKISTKNGDRLIQTSTGMDFTEEIDSFSRRFLSKISGLDGFILKNGSPTAGLTILDRPNRGDRFKVAEDGLLFFGGALIERYPGLPVEDEERLRKPLIYDHFLTRTFLLADFRKAITPELLDGFHHKNRTLLSAFNSDLYENMESIVKSNKEEHSEETYGEYRRCLLEATRYPIRVRSNVKIMMEIFNNVSGGLKKKEDNLFLKRIYLYRKGRIHECSLKDLLRSWAIRFEKEDLIDQTYFEPYPVELAPKTGFEK